MDILINATLKPYDKLSRYATFPYYYNTWDDKYQFGTTEHLKNTTDYTTRIVKKGDTLDSLALEAYNNPTYYWVICDFNRIADPFIELPIGAEIKIPTLSNIEFRSY